MAKVAFIAHCLLNQNAKVIGGAKRPGMWEPVIDLLLENGWEIRQMPCPELAFGGVRGSGGYASKQIPPRFAPTADAWRKRWRRPSSRT